MSLWPKALRQSAWVAQKLKHLQRSSSSTCIAVAAQAQPQAAGSAAFACHLPLPVVLPFGIRGQHNLSQKIAEPETSHPQPQSEPPSTPKEEQRKRDCPRERLQAAANDSVLQKITATSGPAFYYKENRLSGQYKKDARQELTVQKLQRLYEDLKAVYKTSKHRSGLTVVDHSGTKGDTNAWWSGISSFLTDNTAKESDTPRVKGLYMYGGVGTGKTMLMDLLVQSAPPQFKLRRTHFHDFMLHIHGMLREQRSQSDPLLQVANRVASDTRVLCLDELFVTDVADAAILNRLFTQLWQQGVVLVATSNRHPDDLYKGGLQRELFLPFIAKLKEETEVHDMNSAVDYRKLAKHKKGLSFTPESSSDPDRELTQHFEELTRSQPGELGPRTVAVQMGRKLQVPLAKGEMCLMTFDELCKKNLGAADYIALAQTFHTVALRGVPVFTPSLKSEAYRFVTLIDVFYENRIQVMCSAEGSPMDIFQNVFSQEDARKQDASKQDELVVDENLAFSKDRTISRLIEMGTKEYLLEHARRHAPCHVLALDERPKESSDSNATDRVAVAA